MGKPILERVVENQKLRDVVQHLDTLSDDDVICAEGKPDWTAESKACVIRIPEFTDMREVGPVQDYFLEVFIAREVLENWSIWRDGRKPALDEKCEALIYFALHDGDIPPHVTP